MPHTRKFNSDAGLDFERVDNELTRQFPGPVLRLWAKGFAMNP